MTKTTCVTWLSIAGVVLLKGVSAMAHQTTAVPPVTLTLTARVVSTTTIDVQVVVRNATDKPVQVEIPNRQPPMELSIIDETGSDRYQCTYENLKKDGKSRSRPAPVAARLDLEPGQAKTYSWTITALCAAGGGTQPMTAGRYQLKARLGSVARTAGSAESVIYSSNVAEVIVPGRP